MDRYSLLFSVKPCVPFPFGKEVALPNGLGELLGFILEPLNIQWTPASRFQLLPKQGDYQTHLTPAQNSVIFDLFLGGRCAVDKILEDWKELQKNGYEYCAVDVPMTTPGLGNLYDVLSENRFFIAGLIPYHYSEQLAVRFQSITPTQVAWDEIKVFSRAAKKLLTLIRSEFERNS